MALDIHVDKLDLRKVEKKFKSLPERVKRTHLLRAERSAANPLRKQIKNEVKQKHNVTGNLAKSIGNVTGKSKENPQIFVGARVRGRHKGHHAHWIEMGTEERIQRSTGRRVGRIKGQKIVHRAYEQQKNIVGKRLVDEVDKQMAKAIRKHFGV